MSADSQARPAVSVIIPTHRRRDKVVRTVSVLDEQVVPGGRVEIIVVVDGTFDDSAEALRRLETRTPLIVVEQPHGGQGAARNNGARRATADVVVFLDDDVTVHEGFLDALLTSVEGGADVVVGRLEITEVGRPSIRGRELADWFNTVSAEMEGGGFSSANMVFSATAVRRSLFESVGGFDESFTAGGTYGAEDGELGHRLLQAGADVRFAPNARATTAVEGDPAVSIARAYDMGRNHVRLGRKHPELRDEAFDEIRSGSRIYRVVERACAVPFLRPLVTAAANITTPLVRQSRDGPVVHRLLLLATAASFWRGVADAGGIPTARTVRVLCYHALTDLAHDEVLAGYGVPVEVLRRQLATLRRAGFTFVTPDEALAVAHGGRVARRAILLTFDDAYADLAAAAAVVEEAAAPGIIFVVSDQLGGTNTWDQARGARPLPLLDAAALKALQARGWEIGSHSSSHAYLTRSDDDALFAEVAGSRDGLAAEGLPPRVFAYPHGDHDDRVTTAVADAGYIAAFTVQEGVVSRAHDPMRLPRVEIYPWDVGTRLVAKVLSGGRSEAWRNAAGRGKRRLLRR